MRSPTLDALACQLEAEGYSVKPPDPRTTLRSYLKMQSGEVNVTEAAFTCGQPPRTVRKALKTLSLERFTNKQGGVLTRLQGSDGSTFLFEDPPAGVEPS